MRTWNKATDATALTSAGTKTMPTIEVPAGAKSIVGVGVSIGGAAFATAEVINGALKIYGDAVGQEHKFMLPTMTLVTSGANSVNPYMASCAIPITDKTTISSDVTLDDGITNALTGRVFIQFSNEEAN